MSGLSDSADYLLQLPAETRLQIYETLFPAIAFRILTVGRSLNCYGSPLFDRLPFLKDVEAGNIDPLLHMRSQVQNVRPYALELDNDDGVEQDLTQQEAIENLLRLAKTCRSLYAEVVPWLRKELEVWCRDISSACWYGLTFPFLASFVGTLYIDDDLCSHQGHFTETIRQRWLKQLLRGFPNLQYLVLNGIHHHKNKARWATEYKREDLRLMKFVLDNGPMTEVYRGPHAGNPCELEADGAFIKHNCWPTIVFGTSDGWDMSLQRFLNTEFPGAIRKINVDQELIDSTPQPRKRRRN